MTLVLVLDDYHLITTPAIHEALTFLIDRLPPSLRLVMTTRVEEPYVQLQQVRSWLV